MNIPLVDRGTYYRGLLVLVRKDKAVNVRERELMLQLGKVLDFDRRFCEAAIDDLLENKHIKDEPVKFSSKAAAECFIRDAISLALVDGELHPEELSWLEAVVTANGLNGEWLKDELAGLRQSKHNIGSQSHS